MAGIIILFNASVILLFAIIYMMGRSIGWVERWDGFVFSEEQVIFWDWVLASVFMMASFGVGIAGGIVSIRGTRFHLAIVSAVMLLISSIIISLDFRTWEGDPFGEVAFVLVLAIVPLALLMLSKYGFTAPLPRTRDGLPIYGADNYGWDASGPGDGTLAGPGRGGMGP